MAVSNPVSSRTCPGFGAEGVKHRKETQVRLRDEMLGKPEDARNAINTQTQGSVTVSSVGAVTNNPRGSLTWEGELPESHP